MIVSRVNQSEELVRAGLATAAAQRVRAGHTAMEIATLRITTRAEGAGGGEGMNSESQFRSPFSNRQQVLDFTACHRAEDAKAKVKDRQMLAAGEQLGRGLQIRESVRCIYRWKLQSFLRLSASLPSPRREVSRRGD
jgi:hypothetical protein